MLERLVDVELEASIGQDAHQRGGHSLVKALHPLSTHGCTHHAVYAVMLMGEGPSSLLSDP